MLTSILSSKQLRRRDSKMVIPSPHSTNRKHTAQFFNVAQGHTPKKQTFMLKWNSNPRYQYKSGQDARLILGVSNLSITTGRTRHSYLCRGPKKKCLG
jgi:hypothetical protein